ncbi:UNKNOWN [Stylonychia lemnae]|uniref:Protein kinase domain-containing protein n=1 Tax=Stylonychia lemnae TaxID=5949 RepID=A0A077ZYA9_STYLE|nr:UNKNOWN [Stylonychia lemnae]|eukprot:CDW74891.1 UNKNOWN [Stylonychia lemnae]
MLGNVLHPRLIYDGNYIIKCEDGQQLQYLVYEYIPMDVEEFYQIQLSINEIQAKDNCIKQMLTSVKEFHRLGFIHQNIKPSSFKVKDELLYLLGMSSSRKSTKTPYQNSITGKIPSLLTQSIFVAKDLPPLKGDDLISCLYSILIIFEPQNVSWVDICSKIQDQPSIEKQEQIIRLKENLNSSDFEDYYCQIIVALIGELQDLRQQDVQKYSEALNFEGIQSRILNMDHRSKVYIEQEQSGSQYDKNQGFSFNSANQNTLKQQDEINEYQLPYNVSSQLRTDSSRQKQNRKYQQQSAQNVRPVQGNCCQKCTIF